MWGDDGIATHQTNFSIYVIYFTQLLIFMVNVAEILEKNGEGEEEG